MLELIAGDRPGLLCDVGKVLMEERIELQAAKIMTVGERAEDVFYVTDFENRPLDEAAAQRLQGSPDPGARPPAGRLARIMSGRTGPRIGTIAPAMHPLQPLIDAAFERRAEITPASADVRSSQALERMHRTARCRQGSRRGAARTGAGSSMSG